MRLCVLGSGDDLMSFTARRFLKILARSATIYCSGQEYDTSSTANDEGNHCEKDGGWQNNTTLSVDYSKEGSKAVLEKFRACNVPVLEHQAWALWACGVSLREHEVSGARRESDPSVSCVVASSLVGIKPQETALTAPEGASGSELFLLDERRDSPVIVRK